MGTDLNSKLTKLLAERKLTRIATDRKLVLK